MATQRWIVTYTKHMKQKRKVYQDGMLELCSSSGTPQVILFDDCEKLIDRRFLRKDDIVKSGGTLSFETHIVEIGDPDGSSTPPAESYVKSDIRLESQKEKLCEEWNVLYTTQMTQKTKRYNDGVLQIPACSSHLNLITLLSEDGATLSRKYIKSDECFGTGISFEFPNYLVEICERRVSTAIQEEFCDVRSSCKDLLEKDVMNHVPHKFEKSFKLGSSRKSCKIQLHNVPKKEVTGCIASNTKVSAALSNIQKNHSINVTNSCSPKVDNVRTSTSAPLRDACQILLVLKKPSPEERLVLEDPSVEQSLTSESSGDFLVLHADFKGSSEAECVSSSRSSGSSNNSSGPSGESPLSSLLMDYSGLTAGELPSSCWAIAADASQRKSGIKNKPDEAILDIGFSEKAINAMDPVVPLEEETLGASNRLPGTEIKCLLSHSAPHQAPKTGATHEAIPCAAATSAVHVPCAAATSAVHAGSGASKAPETSTLLENFFPTFDLGF